MTDKTDVLGPINEALDAATKAFEAAEQGDYEAAFPLLEDAAAYAKLAAAYAEELAQLASEDDEEEDA